MKNRTVLIIAAVSVVIGIWGFSTGTAANRRRVAAENKAAELQKKLAQAEAGYSEEKKSVPETVYQEDPAETNTVPQLEAELAALRTELAEASNNRRSRREGWQERMARMKEEDPEGYAEMIKRREERQQAMRYDLARRTAGFLDLDTESMTDEERVNHNLLVEKMSRVWELTEKFQDPEQPPDRETMHELFSTINETRPLLDAERTAMFRQLANDLGYEGEEQQAFTAYIEDIISATTIHQPRGGGRGRSPGPRTE